MTDREALQRAYYHWCDGDGEALDFLFSVLVEAGRIGARTVDEDVNSAGSPAQRALDAALDRHQ